MESSSFKFTIPLAPQSASRPKYNPKTGRSTGRAYMPQRYRKWREDFEKWFNPWLEQEEHFELLKVLGMSPDGKPLRGEDGSLDSHFCGYAMDVELVMKRPKGSSRIFPMRTIDADIDNLYKAVSDAIFENEIVKETGANDRWIQQVSMAKRYAMPDEDPHIEVEVSNIWV